MFTRVAGSASGVASWRRLQVRKRSFEPKDVGQGRSNGQGHYRKHRNHSPRGAARCALGSVGLLLRRMLWRHLCPTRAHRRVRLSPFRLHQHIRLHLCCHTSTRPLQ